MNAEDAVIDDSRQRQVIEDISAVAPNIERAILSQAFIVKPVNLCDLSALVVSANEGHEVWISDFICEK